MADMSAADGPEKAGPEKSDLLGSWQLASVELTGEDAVNAPAPFGGYPEGILHYLADGRMAVIIQASRGARSYANDVILKHLIDALAEMYPHIPICMHQDHGNSPATCATAITRPASTRACARAMLAGTPAPRLPPSSLASPPAPTRSTGAN